MKLTRWLMLLLLAFPAARCCAQPELMAWGNLRGIRIQGQLMEFETSLQLVAPDGTSLERTAAYSHRPSYHREGAVARVDVRLGPLDCRESVESLPDPGSARVAVTFNAREPASGSGCFVVEIPPGMFQPGTTDWIDPQPSASSAGAVPARAAGVRLRGPSGELEILSDAAVPIELAPARSDNDRTTLRFVVLTASSPTNQPVTRVFTIKARGEIDTAPATVTLDPDQPGRAFDGIGGNFRLQFPKADPAVIDYNLAHLRVAWSRVAVWWQDWDPDESRSPLAAARAGRVPERQREQMRMAQRLALAGIPVIVSAWDPPAWATLKGPKPPGIYSDIINPEKFQRVASSIADFLLFLKESHGVEALFFSLNEPDLGLTPEPADYIAFVKLLGREFAARGLTTKILLADTSNGTWKSRGFVRAALQDPASLNAIGAVGFHTWGGCETTNLAAWAEAARVLGLPLLVTEAGMDAEAHRYPDVFLEPAYQLDEIALYVRICAVAQPASILEWQLTADYGLLNGGGVYEHQGPLTPTQRFWNFQQLGNTPPGAFALPVRVNRPALDCAAFGNPASRRYAIHLVNTGATRRTFIEGLPRGLTALRRTVTDGHRGSSTEPSVPVKEGKAELTLDALSYVTLEGIAGPQL
ncbi:MAG: hypothetical protein U1F98_07740 [Verrucomicrobiota bacterium]